MPICTVFRPGSMRSSEQNGNVVEIRRPKAASRRTQVEFLPAALEIMETPASPAGRGIAATIILFVVIAVVWSILGRIDIVATASGKVVPTGRTKTVQPLEPGIVSAILVKDGDRVSAGQIVMRLDQTMAAAERNHIGHDLLAAQLDVARLAALRASWEEGGDPDTWFCSTQERSIAANCPSSRGDDPARGSPRKQDRGSGPIDCAKDGRN